jgi:hypothetical protein
MDRKRSDTEEPADAPESILRPVAFLCYGVSVSTHALAKSLGRLHGRKMEDIDDIREGVATVFDRVKKETGVSLNIDWTPYEGLVTEQNDDLYETTFVHTMWHSVTGMGFSHLNLGPTLEPDDDEKRAIDLFCDALALGKSPLDEAYKGYALGAGTLRL